MAVAKLPQVQYRKGATTKVDQHEIIDHWFEVPLTHGLIFSRGKDAALSSRFADQSIKIFAREVINTSDTLTLPVEKRPYIVYLQGGPGFGSPKTGSIGGWIAELAKTHRVILLDQRGTGMSSPLSARNITAVGDAQLQAEYVELFRADSIIADAEAVREVLLADRTDKRWSTVGQSFGGFLTLSYLSFAPQSLRDSRITAGLAPIRTTVDNVYEHTFDRMAERNKEYYSWFPEDAALATRIAEHLRTHEEFLPTGERLTDHRFQMAGHYLGGRWRERGLHYFLETAFAEGDDHLSDQFLSSMSGEVSFLANPLYALMHETIYADGPADGNLPGIPGFAVSPSPAPTNWAAARVAAKRPEFALMLRRFSSRASIFSPGTTRRIRRCGRLLKWRSCSRRRKIGVVSTIMSSFTGMRFLWSRRLILRIFMWIMRIPWRPPGGWVTPMCGRRRLITMMVLALTR